MLRAELRVEECLYQVTFIFPALFFRPHFVSYCHTTFAALEVLLTLVSELSIESSLVYVSEPKAKKVFFFSTCLNNVLSEHTITKLFIILGTGVG